MVRFKTAEARLSLATTGPFGVFSSSICIWAAEELLSKGSEIKAFSIPVMWPLCRLWPFPWEWEEKRLRENIRSLVWSGGSWCRALIQWCQALINGGILAWNREVERLEIFSALITRATSMLALLTLGFCLNLILKSYPAHVSDCQTLSRGRPEFDWPFPPDQRSAFACYFLHVIFCMLFSRLERFRDEKIIFPGSVARPHPHWRDSRASIVMIMEGDRRCLWFLGALLKSAAIHPLRNIGGVSRTRLWANADSTADSPRCPRWAETINGPRVANIRENIKVRCWKGDALPPPAISVCWHDDF